MLLQNNHYILIEKQKQKQKQKNTVHKARDSQEIKDGRFWVVDFTFILFFSTSGGWRGSALSLVSFLDQLCLWIYEVTLEFAGVSWFSPEAVLSLCCFHNLWLCGIFINDSSVSRAGVFCLRCLNEPAGSTQAIMVTFPRMSELRALACGSGSNGDGCSACFISEIVMWLHHSW